MVIIKFLFLRSYFSFNSEERVCSRLNHHWSGNNNSSERPNFIDKYLYLSTFLATFAREQLSDNFLIIKCKMKKLILWTFHLFIIIFSFLGDAKTPEKERSSILFVL